MGTLATDNRQATLIYYPGGPINDDLTAYAESSNKKMKIVDLSKEKLTGTQWSEVADGLGKRVQDLVNQNHQDFVEQYGTENPDLDEHDWITVLTNSPKVLSRPILINGDTFHEIERISQFSQLMDSDSAGLEKPYPNPQKK
ncbi:arsenate reductase family protein [Flagellimonas sp. S174]|uniref:arsenate reductase family protein n=1 Tax=Flagellimonas sp. S174 TaxID=3410790 RepID=UPI003BF49ACF